MICLSFEGLWKITFLVLIIIVGKPEKQYPQVEENLIVTAGSGNIKENDIFGHESSSIYIRSNSHTYVDHNRLHSFNQECIFIEAKSRCVLDSNQIFKDFSKTDAVRVDGRCKFWNYVRQ